MASLRVSWGSDDGECDDSDLEDVRDDHAFGLDDEDSDDDSGAKYYCCELLRFQDFQRREQPSQPCLSLVCSAGISVGIDLS